MHATEFLAEHKTMPDVPVVVVYGAERYLKLEVLKLVLGDAGDDDDSCLTRVAGRDADLRSVCDELLTVSMFGDQRVVLVEDADDFVSANRPGLEKYVASPSRSSLLILDVKSWPKNTKLAKATAKCGVNIECTELKGAALGKWLIRAARREHDKQLDSETAALIVQLAGDSLGLLQQELEKLAALVGDAESITQEDVVRVVGGWRIETTWAMLDAIRDGNLSAALQDLDKLLLAGDAPQKILGGLVFTFRKLAVATELARQTRDLPGALRSAGVFPNAIAPAERYLKRLGFERASRLFQWMVEADANMKGGSRVDPKLQLEALFVRLAAVPAGSRRSSATHTSHSAQV